MLIGMGTVFAFLTILVLSLQVMSALLQRVEPAPPQPPPLPLDASARDVRVQAAISAAVHLHRRRQGRS